MEFEGFKRCLDFILNGGMSVSTLISDRHISIAKYMREEKKNITHFFDLWDLKKSKSLSFFTLIDLVLTEGAGGHVLCLSVVSKVLFLSITYFWRAPH